MYAIRSYYAEQAAFFDGIEITYCAIIRFVKRLADEVDKYSEQSVKSASLAKALKYLATNPPSSLHEALVMGLLYWKLQESYNFV